MAVLPTGKPTLSAKLSAKSTSELLLLLIRMSCRVVTQLFLAWSLAKLGEGKRSGS
jgi:hypothetical protein